MLPYVESAIIPLVALLGPESTAKQQENAVRALHGQNFAAACSVSLLSVQGQSCQKVLQRAARRVLSRHDVAEPAPLEARRGRQGQAREAEGAIECAANVEERRQRALKLDEP